MTNHGTNQGYNGGCRCGDCRRAHAAYRAAWRRRQYLTRGAQPGYVSCVGTRRRVRALEAIGWSFAAMDRELGKQRGYTSRTLKNEKVHRDTAAAFAAMYDRLSMTPGPSARSKVWAAKVGAVPPLAWDDDVIDDPAATPDLGDETAPMVGRLYLDEVVWFLEEIEPCATSKRADERFGVAVGTVQQFLRRAGRRDLLDRLVRNGEAAA